MLKKKKLSLIARFKKSKALKTPWKKNLIIALLVLIILSALYFARSLFVVALVNNRPISRWSFNRDLQKAAGEQILNNKIAEMLVLQEGQKQKIDISDEEIDEESKKLDEQLQSQGQSLDSLLTLQGQSKKEFLKQIKIQLLVEKILGEEIEISEEAVADYFEENQDFFAEGATLASEKENIRQILFNNQLTEKIQPWLSELQDKAKVHYFIEF
jgi:hypothetical protein